MHIKAKSTVFSWLNYFWLRIWIVLGMEVNTISLLAPIQVDALMECLLKERDKDKTTKSIVVSQFTSFLDIVQKPLM